MSLYNAATAAGLFSDLPSAAAAMTRDGAVRCPDPARHQLYARDYRAFLMMHEQRRALDAVLAPGAG